MNQSFEVELLITSMASGMAKKQENSDWLFGELGIKNIFRNRIPSECILNSMKATHPKFQL